MKVIGVSKMVLKADSNSMSLRVNLIDLADASSFKGVKIRNQDEISW